MAKNRTATDEARIPGIDFEPDRPRDREPAAPAGNGGPGASAAKKKKPAPASYSMIEPRMKAIYGQFYKETYFSDRAHLDTRTQELIALACSLAAQCEGCFDGHLKKALKAGATKEEISEAIVIAIGINAAAIVDQTDRSAARLGLNHFPVEPRPRKSEG